MLIGYMRVSKADGSQVFDLQRDALIEAGVRPDMIFEDRASGKLDERPGLDACLKSLREGDVLVVWKLDRLGRNLKHLVNTAYDLTGRSVGLRVLTGQGAAIDTTTPAGRLMLGVFAALAEFERDLIVERTKAGLAAANARGRFGGRKFTLSKTQIEMASAALKDANCTVQELAESLGVGRTVLYGYMDSAGNLRDGAKKVLERAA